MTGNDERDDEWDGEWLRCWVGLRVTLWMGLYAEEGPSFPFLLYIYMLDIVLLWTKYCHVAPGDILLR